MNAVEIEEAVSALAEAPFNAQTFPYDFLQAFGLNDAGIRKLKSGDTNKSDLPGGVLQRNKNNIHILVCRPGNADVLVGSGNADQRRVGPRRLFKGKCRRGLRKGTTIVLGRKRRLFHDRVKSKRNVRKQRERVKSEE
jgi:hypothetical protein